MAPRKGKEKEIEVVPLTLPRKTPAKPPEKTPVIEPAPKRREPVPA